MAIEVHSSSPSLVFGHVKTVTTDSFTPPAGALLVASVMSKYDSSIPLTNGGSSLLWTQQVLAINTNAISAIYTAPAIAQFTTVTATIDYFGGSETTAPLALKIYVLTGADVANPVGAKNAAQNTGVQDWNWTPFSSAEADSLSICAACDDYQTNINSSTDPYEQFNQMAPAGTGSSSWLSGLALRKATPVDASGTPVTFNIHCNASSPSTKWAATAVEIRAATTPRPRPLAITSSAHRAGAW
ncbi:hypothetical protein ACIBG8_07220 [Nonomuraea sp. NPDC050556]|uniref:hypothetical protein n=1 Tax=Nonomuraea sp. NPDC050556 TaxID=3364369 RepID=UPI0037ACF482